jgi:hypothetical protein
VNCSSENGPLLSVATPVFNGAGFIVENVDIIRSEFAGVSQLPASTTPAREPSRRSLATRPPRARNRA